MDGNGFWSKCGIYPTHIRLNLRDDEENTAWLRCLILSSDEAGNRYEKVSTGLRPPEAKIHTSWPASSGKHYFGDAKHLAVYITGAAWLDKEWSTWRWTWIRARVGPLPDWMRMEKLEHLGKDRYRISLSAPCRGLAGIISCCGGIISTRGCGALL
jgi:hypothetical protein